MGPSPIINCIIGSAGHVDGEQRRMSAKNAIRRTADGIVPPASGAMSMCARSTRPLELITVVACPLEWLRADGDMIMETLQCVGKAVSVEGVTTKGRTTEDGGCCSSQTMSAVE